MIGRRRFPVIQADAKNKPGDHGGNRKAEEIRASGVNKSRYDIGDASGKHGDDRTVKQAYNT